MTIAADKNFKSPTIKDVFKHFYEKANVHLIQTTFLYSLKTNEIILTNT
jgi:hypothetical protein